VPQVPYTLDVNDAEQRLVGPKWLDGSREEGESRTATLEECQADAQKNNFGAIR
jgi:hypothetical protein